MIIYANACYGGKRNPPPIMLSNEASQQKPNREEAVSEEDFAQGRRESHVVLLPGDVF